MVHTTLYKLLLLHCTYTTKHMRLVLDGATLFLMISGPARLNLAGPARLEAHAVYIIIVS